MPATTTVTVGTTETAIFTATHNKTRIRIHNVGTQTVYLGETGVTTADGFPLQDDTAAPGGAAELEMTLAKGDVLYGIVAATTAEVRTIVISDRDGIA